MKLTIHKDLAGAIVKLSAVAAKHPEGFTIDATKAGLTEAEALAMLIVGVVTK